MSYEHERDEWRAAVQHADRRTHADCYRHDMRPDGNGGGVCTGCGMTVTADEL